MAIILGKSGSRDVLLPFQNLQMCNQEHRLNTSMLQNMSVIFSNQTPHTMTTTPLNALKSLSELALTVPAEESLIVYDSVAILATRLALSSSPPLEDGDLQALATRAAFTAEAIRTADQCVLDFRHLLGGAEE